MKARILTSESQIKQVVDEEVRKRLADYFTEVTRNTTYRTIAVVLRILERDYGFRKKRLHDVKNRIESEFCLMETGIFGQNYDQDDIVKYLKEKYDIDFEESQYKERDTK